MAYNEFAYFYDEFNGEADYDALRATGSHPSGRSSEKLPAHRPGKMHISRAIYRKSVR